MNLNKKWNFIEKNKFEFDKDIVNKVYRTKDSTYFR